jgi:hypothetical protein
MGFFKDHPKLTIFIDMMLMISAAWVLYQSGYTAGYQDAQTAYQFINNLNPIIYGVYP